MSTFPKAIYRFKNSYQNSNGIFHKKTEQTILIFFMEIEKTPNRKAILRKSKAGSITLPDFKLYYKAKVINEAKA